MHDPREAPLMLQLHRHHLPSRALRDQGLLQGVVCGGRPELLLHDGVHCRHGLTQLAPQRVQLGGGCVRDAALLIERRLDTRLQLRVVGQRLGDAPQRRRGRAVRVQRATGQAHGAQLRGHGLQVRGAQARAACGGVRCGANVLRAADAESWHFAQQPARLGGGRQPGSRLGRVGCRPQRADVVAPRIKSRAGAGLRENLGQLEAVGG